MRRPIISSALLVTALAGCADDVEDVEEDELETSTAALTVSGGNFVWYYTPDFVDPIPLKQTLNDLRDANVDIDAMATTATGAWIVVAGNASWQSAGFPWQASSAVQAVINAGEKIHAIDFNANGGWIVVGDTSVWSGGAVPNGLVASLTSFMNSWSVQDVEISNGGYLILGAGSAVSYSGIDADLAAFLYDRRASGRHVQAADIGFDGRWIAVADQEVAFENVSAGQRSAAQNRAINGQHISHFMLGPGNSYALYSQGSVQPSSSVMEQLEYTLPTGSLRAQMNSFDVPGLSIAIVQNNKVVASRGYGFLKKGEEDHVLATTPFDLASLSKYVGALTMMRLAGDGSLTINDSIVNTAKPSGIIEDWSYFGSDPFWSQWLNMPGSPALPAGISVHTLLTHTAGLIPMGGSAKFDAQWNGFGSHTTLDYLLGFDCGSPSNPNCGYNGNKYAWTQNGTVGGTPNYESVNFLVAQAVAEDAGNAPVADLLDTYFFAPMALTDTTGATPPDASFLARTAWQHRSFVGPASEFAVTPWVFAGGIHASARDYAELMIIALNQGSDSSGVQRIHPFTAYLMLQGVGAGNGFGYGLRTEGGNDASSGTDRAFFHNGWHSDRALTYMCGNPTRDEGIVILSNTDDINGGNNVLPFLQEIAARYAAVRGWPGNCR